MVTECLHTASKSLIKWLHLL